MRRATILVASLLLLLLSAAGLEPVAAQPQFDVSVLPAKFEMEMAPGTYQEFEISLHNHGSADQFFKVYFMDYYIEPDNVFVFEEPGHYSYSCATWLSTDTPQLFVPAGAVVQKRFGAAVPPEAEPGGHYGAIMFEQVPPEADEPVRSAGRLASLALVTVPGEIIRQGEIQDVHVDSAWFWPTRKYDGLPRSRIRYRAVFKNTGNVHLTVKAKLTYAPTFGWGTGSLDLEEMTVLPDTERYFEGEIPDPPLFGSFTVKVEAMYGPSLYEFDTTRTAEGSFNCYPISLLVLLLIIVAAIIMLIMLRRHLKKEKARRQEEKAQEEREKEEPPEGEEPQQVEEPEEAKEEEQKALEPQGEQEEEIRETQETEVPGEEKEEGAGEKAAEPVSEPTGVLAGLLALVRKKPAPEKPDQEHLEEESESGASEQAEDEKEESPRPHERPERKEAEEQATQEEEAQEEPPKEKEEEQREKEPEDLKPAYRPTTPVRRATRNLRNRLWEWVLEKAPDDVSGRSKDEE